LHEDSCFATTCNWIYIGPTDLPCEELLQPDIRHAEIGLTVALFDATPTYGMTYNTTWDLGDGGQASGQSVIHTYQDTGTYPVVATSFLSGPLTATPCSTTTSFSVQVPGSIVAAGISETDAAPPLTAAPVPFSADVVITGTGVQRGDVWQLFDAAGRLQLQGVAGTSLRFTVEGDALAPGIYVLRVQGDRPAVVRLVKE
jgi:hypothetical protein